jgi:hypothetical protein
MWQLVGGQGFPVSNSTYDFELDGSGTPYIAFNHASRGASVARASGDAWDLMGDALDTRSNDFSIAFDAGTPHLAMITPGETAKVFSYEDSSWQQRGENVTTSVEEIDLLIANGVPYLAFTRVFAEEEPTIMTWK